MQQQQTFPSLASFQLSSGCPAIRPPAPTHLAQQGGLLALGSGVVAPRGQGHQGGGRAGLLAQEFVHVLLPLLLLLPA